MRDFLIYLVGFLQGQWWAAPVFLAAYAGACLFAPVTVFAVTSGVLFGFWGGLAVNVFGALLGATAAFSIARRWGLRAVERIVGKNFYKFESYMDLHGFGALLSIRLIGFPPFVVTNYLAGLSGISLRKFLAASALGILPWTVLISYFADGLWAVFVYAGTGEFHQALWTRAKVMALLSASAGAIVLLTVLWGKKKKT